jgi:hypothetical protein
MHLGTTSWQEEHKKKEAADFLADRKQREGSRKGTEQDISPNDMSPVTDFFLLGHTS